MKMTDAAKIDQAKIDEERAAALKEAKAAALKAAEEQAAAAEKEVAEIQGKEKKAADDAAKIAVETSPGLIEAPSAVSTEARIGQFKELKKEEAIDKIEEEFANRPKPTPSAPSVPSAHSAPPAPPPVSKYEKKWKKG